MKKLAHFLSLILCVFILAGCTQAESGKSKITVPKDSVGLYAYECLDEKEKNIYDTMLYVMNNHYDRQEVDTIDDESMKKVFFFVLKDHPEIFWCSSFNRYSTKYNDGSIKTEFEPIYTMTKSERYSYQEQIDKVTDSWLARVPSGSDDYTKAKIIFDLLASEVKYVSNSPENQNIISVFINKKTVCQGYSKAFEYLLGKVGIESTLVKGESKDNAHAWNLVKLDGDYYYFDVTWATPGFDNKNDVGDYINYAYFAVTTEDILTDHKIVDELPLPECTATKDNYFVKEGLLFDTNNPNIVGDAIYTADFDGKNYVSLKFASDGLYDWAQQYFITDRNVFDFYKSGRKLYMLYYSNLRVLSFLFNQN